MILICVRDKSEDEVKLVASTTDIKIGCFTYSYYLQSNGKSACSFSLRAFFAWCVNSSVKVEKEQAHSKADAHMSCTKIQKIYIKIYIKIWKTNVLYLTHSHCVQFETRFFDF